jgi:hypothetical protein
MPDIEVAILPHDRTHAGASWVAAGRDDETRGQTERGAVFRSDEVVVAYLIPAKPFG